MWANEVINHLYEAGLDNDNLPLIHNANTSANIAVKTPFGITSRKAVNNVILQGTIWGPLQCIVQLEEVAKRVIIKQNCYINTKGKLKPPSTTDR